MAVTREIVTIYDFSIENSLTFMSDPALQDYLGKLAGVKNRRLTGLRHEGNMRYWNVEVNLAEKVPAWARGVAGIDTLHWIQHFSLNLETLHFDLTVETPVPDRVVVVSGRGRLEALGPDRSQIVVVLNIHSQIPVLGRTIENTLADQVGKMLSLDAERRKAYIKARLEELAAQKAGQPQA